jgi:hypothetical protein
MSLMPRDTVGPAHSTAPSRPWWILPTGRIHAGWWLVVAPLLIAIDYAAGPDAQLPAIYVLPVCVAAWYSGERAAIALAVAVPLAHAIFALTVWAPLDNVGLVIGTAAIRGLVVAFIALVFARQSEHERQLRRDLERRHALELRAEQLRVVQVTVRTVQDIVNNCLNQLLLLRLDAEAHVSPEAVASFDEAIRSASAQLQALAELDAYAEKQMEMGTALDVGDAALGPVQPVSQSPRS